MLELQLIVNSDGQISNNVDAFCKEVTEACKKYNYLVDDENYEQAKEDHKVLMKVLDNVPRQRIDCEKAILNNWNPIKSMIMASEKEIKLVKETLKDGIDAVDNAEKEKKKETIKQAFAPIIFPKDFYINFELIWDPKWANKSVSKKQWAEELQIKIDKVIQDISLMDSFMPIDETEKEQVKEVYEQSIDIGLAKAKADQLKAIRERVEKANLEKRAETIEEVKPQAERQEQKQAANDIIKRQMTISGTIKDMTALQAYMKEHNIQLHKVERL